MRPASPRLRHLHIATAVVVVANLAAPLSAQSLLDRSPNLWGNWVARPGTVQFNFLHRFTRSDAPERKISNFPTFAVAVGPIRNVTVGFHYASNSTLTPRFPNEWEFFGRYALLVEGNGAPLDVAGQIAYNLSSEGVDGELSLGKRIGPVRLIGVGRFLADPFEEGHTQFAVGGGGTVRLHRHIALAGDAVALTNRDPSRDESVAWSAGVHLAIPRTPHTLSLQVANVNTATLQGSSRGGSERRYGFEFTIPITLGRFFGRQPTAPQGGAGEPAITPSAMPSQGDEVIQAAIRQMAFGPSRIEIPVGATVTWTNEDPLAHTVTADDGTFNSGLLNTGQTWSYTFTTPGEYPFFCIPHPFMKGVVVVRGES
ncbi:MAG TPA: cupredoxin family copper-binding protein [Gemmatimonadales bacterium]|nr:cupredoxin family copper-binding protein [Gemmatimonadales bacterium]